jgi:hypothetical protein
MKKFITVSFTFTGGLLGRSYVFLTIGAIVPAMIASDIPVPVKFVDISGFPFRMIIC